MVYFWESEIAIVVKKVYLMVDKWYYVSTFKKKKKLLYKKLYELYCLLFLRKVEMLLIYFAL